MSNELVSVYIPTRNRSELLERAIDSVLDQSQDDLEIIVGDDASTDRTPELLARYARAHKNIVFLRNDKPASACNSRNKAISAARGTFITGLDDDDEFLPDQVPRFVEHSRPRWTCLSALRCPSRHSASPISWSGRPGSSNSMTSSTATRWATGSSA